MPSSSSEPEPPHRRRHPVWAEFHVHDRWLYDSWEGGPRYRNATYGIDTGGLEIHNLVRHKHERPPTEGDYTDVIGADAAARAAEGDFQYRRARTPVPPLMRYAVEAHLSKLYAREVEREGPADLADWWKDVDGAGTAIDAWMKGVVAPMFLALGKLDLAFDHPAPPDGEPVESLADKAHYKLGSCVASIILPWNMVWWRLDARENYAECVVREPLDSGGCNFRHWTAEGSTLYDDDGNQVGKVVPHKFGRVPIVRVFDQKIPRLKNAASSRYEPIAEYQREYYNRDSELILSDTHQAFPLLQGPEEWCSTGKNIPMGPTFLLPMKREQLGTSITYQGFEVVPFPKEGADSIRKNMANILDAVDRIALLTKPAGAAGTDGSTVAQSGLSKRLDQAAGNDLLTKIAERIEAAELAMARMALVVLSDGAIDDSPELLLAYPRTFDLSTAEELSADVEQFQATLKASGAAPYTETEMLQRLVRRIIPGLLDGQYAEADDEIKAVVEANAKAMKDAAKQAADAAKAAALAPPPPPAPAKPPQLDSAAAIDSAEAAQGDPTTNVI